MKPEEIHITDIMRILQGEAPWSFLLEGIIRIVFIYILIMVSMRLMGKRMASSLTRNEMAALVSLAAAIGVPLQSPDKGLLPAVIICAIVVGVQRSVAYYTFKSARFERVSQGNISVLVEDGKMNLDNMKRALVSQERLFAELRHQSIINMGKVQRIYMENSGNFCVMTYDSNKTGLSMIPEWDEDFTSDKNRPEGIYACCSCGNVVNSKTKEMPDSPCERCSKVNWGQAIES